MINIIDLFLVRKGDKIIIYQQLMTEKNLFPTTIYWEKYKY